MATILVNGERKNWEEIDPYNAGRYEMLVYELKAMETRRVEINAIMDRLVEQTRMKFK